MRRLASDCIKMAFKQWKFHFSIKEMSKYKKFSYQVLLGKFKKNILDFKNIRRKFRTNDFEESVDEILPKFAEYAHGEFKIMLHEHQRSINKIEKKRKKISERQKMINSKLFMIKSVLINLKKKLKLEEFDIYIKKIGQSEKFLDSLEMFNKISEIIEENSLQISLMKVPSPNKKKRKFKKMAFPDYIFTRKLSTNLTIAKFEKSLNLDFDEMKKILSSPARKRKYSSFDMIKTINMRTIIEKESRRPKKKPTQKFNNLHPALIIQNSNKNIDSTSRGLILISTSIIDFFDKIM